MDVPFVSTKHLSVVPAVVEEVEEASAGAVVTTIPVAAEEEVATVEDHTVCLINPQMIPMTKSQ